MEIEDRLTPLELRGLRIARAIDEANREWMRKKAEADFSRWNLKKSSSLPED